MEREQILALGRGGSPSNSGLSRWSFIIISTSPQNSFKYSIMVLTKIWNMMLCYLEKAMAPHSSTLAWKIPWMEEPGGLQSMGSLQSDRIERLYFHFSLWCIGEGNGNPLQCSCLKNPRDGGSWWAAVYGVAQCRTRQKWLSSSSKLLGEDQYSEN